MIIAEIEISSSVAKVKCWDAAHLNTASQSPPLRKHKICETNGNLLPAGASGLKVRFTFLNEAWRNLAKTAVFRNKHITMDAVIVDDCATIPHEVLSKVTDVVEVGIYGTDSANCIAIPTVWAKLGSVASAANPSGISSAEATLPYWAQIKEQLDTMQVEMMDQEDLQEALRQARESGDFDGPQGTPGASGYSPVKGIDYWTQAEKDAIAAEAANAASKAISSSSDIICEKTGDTIVLSDAAQRELHGLILYGKTVQNGTPTPDHPVELENAAADGNLLISVTDGTEENVQTFSVSLPSGLPGVPTASDGNYVDGSGQQWVCDTVDFAKGVYVQRLMKLSLPVAEMNNSEDFPGWKALPAIRENMERKSWLLTLYKPGLCSIGLGSRSIGINNQGGSGIIYLDKGFYGLTQTQWKTQYPNLTVEILLPMDYTITRALTPAELVRYSALHTNKPNTTISNHGGAGMGVGYVADTKRYIDQKFAELASAVADA